MWLVERYEEPDYHDARSTPAPAATAQAPTAAVTAPPTTAAPVAHVGATLGITDEAGNKMNVTLLKVIDPAAGADQFTTPDAGKRFVAVEIQIAGVSGTVQGDANSDLSTVGSDNQTYTSDADSVQGCTDFNYGDYQLTAGETATGCVTFQIPTGVAVVKVIDSPNAALPGSVSGQWQVP